MGSLDLDWLGVLSAAQEELRPGHYALREGGSRCRDRREG